VNGKIHCGINTGFNAAFVIDGAKRAELIATDPKNAEIIKPFLRGRDVKRWKAEARDLYLIVVQNSGDRSAHNAWANATGETEARAIFKAIYPAIHDHLTAFETQLRIRRNQGRYWWELQGCAYYSEFEKPKIVYSEMGMPSRFAYDSSGIFINNTAFLIPTDDYYLLGILNSKVVWEYLKRTCSVIGDPDNQGRLQLLTIYVETIPIPDAPDALRTQISALAERCLAAAPDHLDLLPGLESQLNALVYQAYGLTEAEIQIVEGR